MDASRLDSFDTYAHNFVFKTGGAPTTITKIAFGFYFATPGLVATFKIAVMAADTLANSYLPTKPRALLASDVGIQAPAASAGTPGFLSLQILAAQFPNVGALTLTANTVYNLVVYGSSSAGFQTSHAADNSAASIVYGGSLTYPPTAGGACFGGYFSGANPVTATGWTPDWVATANCMNFFVSDA
jgi:hypothetical protein